MDSTELFPPVLDLFEARVNHKLIYTALLLAFFFQSSSSLQDSSFTTLQMLLLIPPFRNNLCSRPTALIFFGLKRALKVFIVPAVTLACHVTVGSTQEFEIRRRFS